VLTTLPVADLTRAPSSTSAVFAHLAIGGAFATRLLFLNVDRTNTANGQIVFIQGNGTPMNIPVEGTTGSQFNYRLPAGCGLQILPGHTNALSTLFLAPFGSTQPASEIAVNEGNSVRAILRAVDVTGRVRDDFDAAYASLDSSVAAVDGAGTIQGKKAGFSTL